MDTHTHTLMITIPAVYNVCRAMLCISAAYVVMQCLCVCLSICVSVKFVSCVKTNKYVIKILFTIG